MSKLKEMETALVRVDEMAAEKRELFVQARTGLQQALCAATAIYELKEALTHEMMRPVMALQGSNLGFLTDKIYPEQAIREVIIEASLRGVPIYGNCFNVIGGRLYVTKQGFRYLLAQVAGLTDLALSFGSVNIQNGQAEISCKASWNLNGKPDALSKTIPVRVNSGMGTDGALGKAERKLLRDVYERVSGAQLNEGEAPEVTAEKQALGRVVDDGKLPASAVVSESGEVPAFLKSKPAQPVEQEGQTDEDRAAMERVNSAPVKPAKPASEERLALGKEMAEKAKASRMDDEILTAAISRVGKVKIQSWRKLSAASLRHWLSDNNWQQLQVAASDIWDERGDGEPETQEAA